MATSIPHFIGGKRFSGNGKGTSPVFYPATGKQTCELALAGGADVDRTVAAAAKAFPEWAETTPLRRARVLNRFLRILEERIPGLAATISAEHGKVVSDAIGEGRRGMDVVEFMAGATQLLKGEFTEIVGARIDSYSIRQPVGAVAGITPFNGPEWVRFYTRLKTITSR